MIRKLAASTFLTLMVMILAFQHPVLGYCGSSHNFFIADCACQTESTPTHSCCASSDQECPAPYHDCCQKISCDSDDLFWSSLPDPAPPTEIPPTLTADLAEQRSPQQPLAAFAPPSYSQPPPDDLPLFLRLGVMRL